MFDVMNIVREDMKKHVVEVQLPGSNNIVSLALIEFTVKASMIDILKSTYGDKFEGFCRQVAEKVFSNRQVDAVFGVFFKEDNMVFAFSRDLADYCPEKKSVIFKDIEEVLIDTIQYSSKPEPPERRPQPARPPGGMVMRYALIEKKV